MTLPAHPIIVIPARMAARRLPGKPLADIHGEPMIVHVWRRAVESGVGPVLVACADAEIAAAVAAAGGEALMTRPDHPSGSDRVFEAVRSVDPAGVHDAVINLQGDLPTIAASAVSAVLDPLRDPEVDIGTVACPVSEDADRGDPNVVKAVVSFAPSAAAGRALYFTRAAAPSGDGPLLHHIGVYAFRRPALERFVGLPPAPLETREKLEQLRALEAGMRIGVAVVDTLPLGVDTPPDLERARAILAPRGAAPGSVPE
ncbi:MAG: 3-deoxy-manno-octulosonate cytidylyltransferase [Alphaproteobacteria bacterium]|nr:3-deoxy-manno-octulosonate cytidylyltransferase [Alphaproteobacteria bacterium]